MIDLPLVGLFSLFLMVDGCCSNFLLIFKGATISSANVTDPRLDLESEACRAGFAGKSGSGSRSGELLGGISII